MWNKQRLQRVYKQHGIKFLKPQLSFRGEFEMDPDDLRRRRQNFALPLLEVMRRPYRNIIYFDETSFHNWMHTERSWMCPN